MFVHFMENFEMSKQAVVKIVGVQRLPYAKVGTIEGMRKIDRNTNTIEVSPKTALQMVDGTNWKLFDEKDKALLQEVQKLEEKRRLRKEEAALESSVADDEEEEEEEEETEQEKVAAVKETEETDTMGDEETKNLIKNLPKMSISDLKETAEELGIKIPDDVKKSWLIKKIVAKLKG